MRSQAGAPIFMWSDMGREAVNAPPLPVTATFKLYQKAFGAGRIRLGGNDSTHTGAQMNCFVMVTLRGLAATRPGDSTLTFEAVATTCVSSESPDTAFGAAKQVKVENRPARQLESYLRFEVSGQAGRTVTGAELWLKQSGGLDTSGTALEVRSVASTWSEASTWNPRPSVGASVSGRRPLGAIGADDLVRITLDAEDFTADGVYLLALPAPRGDAGDVGFWSRNVDAAADRPELMLTATPPATR